MGSNPEVRRQPAHTALVRDAFRTLESLETAAEEVRGLLSHPGWAHVCRLLDDEAAGLDAKLDGSLLEDRADYAWLHGQRRGLRSAVGLAHAIVSVADQRLAEQQAKHERTADAVLGAR